MEELQTEITCNYDKGEERDKEQDNLCTENGLNISEEIDPLDLIDNCEVESVGSNSDVWNASDSEDEERDNISIPENVKNVPDTTANTLGQLEGKGSNTDVSAKNNQNTNAINEPADIKEKDENKIKETFRETDNKCNIDKKENNESNEDGDKMNDENTKSLENSARKDNDTDEEKNESKKTDEADKIENGESNKSAENTLIKHNVDEKKNNKSNDDETSKDGKDNTEDSSIYSAKSSENSSPIKVTESTEDDDQVDYDMDEDFDPSLLCPEVSMDVDDKPVLTANAPVPHDDNSSSPVPYEAVYSTRVDETTGAEISFDLTPEEQELRERFYGPDNPIQNSRIHCTACNVHLGSALQGQNNRFVHPMLKVLICKECYHFYTSGEFEKDEDGSELYCRWCGQGGQVLCCSRCEFVFCKRCIRTNFGRKKVIEISESDNWDCFRCAPSQIMTQRISCYEFFEYIRREMTRASTLDDPNFWAKDHSSCCSSSKKRGADDDEGEKPKKTRKRKRSDIDPDYNPLQDHKDNIVINPTKFLPKPVTPVSIIPKTTQNTNDDIQFVRAIPAPQTVLKPINNPIIIKPTTVRTILPGSIKTDFSSNNNLIRIQGIQTPRPKQIQVPLITPTSSPRLYSTLTQNRSTVATASSTNGLMKHEWFEKTVRASARVNSHLSFTLTQLNRAQSLATSIEDLAVVHNKLQEVLSSSINSLIQIRKSLRADFINGIKTVRLPAKKKPPEPTASAKDDDVIFVSAPTPTVTVAAAPSTSQLTQLQPVVPNTIYLLDKNSSLNIKKINDVTNTTSSFKGYLKVRSVNELQNVPAECITIPDDKPTVSNNNTDIDPLSFCATVLSNSSDAIKSQPVRSYIKIRPKIAIQTIKTDTKTTTTETSTASDATPCIVLDDESDKTESGNIGEKRLESESSASKSDNLDDVKLKQICKVHVARQDLLQLQASLSKSG